MRKRPPIILLSLVVASAAAAAFGALRPETSPSDAYDRFPGSDSDLLLRQAITRVEAAPSKVKISFTGKGEILSVSSVPLAGQTRMVAHTGSDLAPGLEYEPFPSPFVITRLGFSDKTLALTFDDGPEPTFTPLILDQLQALHVPATFFIVGRNAARYPRLIERIWKEGHEIGSHGFSHVNMARVSERRRQSELEATQQVIERTLGRSLKLFRSPYNSDAEPSNVEELLPLLTAARLNYLAVGGFIDPRDWNLGQTKENGWKVLRDPDDIARQVIEMARSNSGNIVVLHDGGGIRWPTVKALPAIVETLRREGFRFVAVSQLLNADRERVMPTCQEKPGCAASASPGYASTS